MPTKEAPKHTALSDAEAGEGGGGGGEDDMIDYTQGGKYKEDEEGVPWPLHKRLEEAAKHPSVGQLLSLRKRFVSWLRSRVCRQDSLPLS